MATSLARLIAAWTDDADNVRLGRTRPSAEEIYAARTLVYYLLAEINAYYNPIGSSVQAWDANLDQLAALTPTNNRFIVGDGSAWQTETPAQARSSLGLGTIATQDANAVAITGGSVTGITDLAVADGGTGASTAAVARTNLAVLQQVAVKKGSNSTLTGTTSATMTMSVAIAASEWWQIRLIVLCASPAADDLRLQINVTGTLDVSFIGTWEGNVARRVHNTDYQILTDGNVQVFEFTGQVQGAGSGGTLDIYAAKWTDTGADATFYNDSNMVLTRLA